ncbi:MAG TPA: class I SAM-dependent methyltransferase [Acidimicrobiales bacterium]|nr:class I SAM-dependent methyltransferase [Acidimicrobiales bacterium]
MSTPADLSFLTPPYEVADWRLVVLADAAAAAGVFAELPGTAPAVAHRLGLDPHGLRVVLDGLVALGALEVRDDGAYGPTDATPDGAAAATLRHHARALRRWAMTVEHRLRGELGGDPIGMADPETFHDSLAASARASAPAVVDACLARFPDAKTVLDLGGLHGEYSLEFARRGLRATMQDQPRMIQVARDRGRLEAAGVELYEGDFFETVPGGPFDLAFCSGITHTFGAEGNLALFANVRPVVAPGGGVAVVTFLRRQNPVAALFAVQMLINDNGGDTHTEAEYREWLTTAGFTVDEGALDLDERGGRSVLFAT